MRLENRIALITGAGRGIGRLCLCRMKGEEICLEVRSDTDVQIVRLT